MKYLEGAIPKSKGELKALLSDIMLRAPGRQFPATKDFDGAFYSAMRGVENIRGRMTESKASQLLEMLAQAKAHYEADENKLGGALMEDAKMTIMGRQPWAYPRELYRWTIESGLPEISEADILNKDDEGE